VKRTLGVLAVLIVVLGGVAGRAWSLHLAGGCVKDLGPL